MQEAARVVCFFVLRSAQKSVCYAPFRSSPVKEVSVFIAGVPMNLSLYVWIMDNFLQGSRFDGQSDLCPTRSNNWYFLFIDLWHLNGMVIVRE